MVEMLAKIAEVAGKAVERLSEASAEIKKKVAELDLPLNSEGSDVSDTVKEKKDGSGLDSLDAPLNKTLDNTSSRENHGRNYTETKEIKKVEKMEPQITIEFTCPERMDRKEFVRQIKGQERGLNSQTITENMDNRAAFERRKTETGNGRDVSEGKKAQEIAREKATQSRIESNQKKGMSYSEAKKEAEEWIGTQAALHNPDQIAGGDPSKVSRMGDANVNSSIGSQWRTRVDQLANAVDDYAKNKTRDELEHTKMNVKLVVI